jgi:[protein-PII] uridylyltransferase
VVSGFVRELWDAGLRVNHAVRTIGECLDLRDENLDLRVSLFDRRLVAGDPRVMQQLEAKLPGFLSKHGAKLGQHLCELARARHTKYQNTVRHQQPDVKSSPGGLRDLQFVRTLAKLYPERLHPGEEVERAGAFLSAARYFLHYQRRTDYNTLDFEAQDGISRKPFADVASASQWMREYCARAETIFNEARRSFEAAEKADSSLLESFRGWRTRLSNSDFTVSRDRILLRNPGQLASDPMLILSLGEFMARHGVAASSETERRLEAAREALRAYCSQPRPLWNAVEAILRLPHAGFALRTLEMTGLLTALLPEWQRIENLVMRDAEHRYTVDERTLGAVERMIELNGTTDPGRRRFAQLLSEIDKPGLLAFALLVHNLGKDAATSTFVDSSVTLAREIMARIETPPADRAEVEFLVSHQSDLAEVIGGRDVGEPLTARQIADQIGTVERLKMLTILTYADLSSASAEAMTSWRMEQLWNAYHHVHHELTRELETDRIQDLPQALGGKAEFLKGFPTRYLRAHSPAEIQNHLELYELSRPTGVAVQLDRMESAYRLTVIARDMPALFASFAGALSSFGLDILKAEAFANARGQILDTFVFADSKRTLEQNPSEVDRLNDLVRRVAMGKTDGQRLLRSQAKPDPKKRTSPGHVMFDSEACETATLVEIEAEDRPGLLYNLATVFSSNACNIDVVLIDTKGRRALDVFYVAHDGKKLSAEMQATLRDKLLEVC